MLAFRPLGRLSRLPVVVSLQVTFLHALRYEAQKLAARLVAITRRVTVTEELIDVSVQV